MKSHFQLIFALLLTFALSGCLGSGGYSSTPWGASTGVVTNDPNSIPDIGWQTSGDRRELAQQNRSFMNQQQQAPQQQSEPGRPGLVYGGAIGAKKGSKVKVAMLLPLTGKHGSLGQSMLKAAQMALFDVGSANFELVPKDTQSTTEGAVRAAQQAAAANASLFIGPIFAEDVKAVKPVSVSSGIPMVAFTTDWTLGGNNTYIMGFLPFAQVARVAQYAETKGYGHVAVYAPITEYCDVVIRTLQRTGTDVVRVNRYSPQQLDLSTLVQEFVASSNVSGNPDNPQFRFNALMLPVGGESLRSLVSVLDLHGVKNENIRFLGTGLWDDPALTSNPALYGGWFAAPDPKLRRDFEQRYQANYGGAPIRLSSLAYDATALAAVLARTGNDPYSRSNMTNPRGFAGIDGIFRFRPDGLNERGLAILEIQAGRARVIDPAPTAFISSGS